MIAVDEKIYSFQTISISIDIPNTDGTMLTFTNIYPMFRSVCTLYYGKTTEEFINYRFYLKKGGTVTCNKPLELYSNIYSSVEEHEIGELKYSEFLHKGYESFSIKAGEKFLLKELEQHTYWQDYPDSGFYNYSDYYTRLYPDGHFEFPEEDQKDFTATLSFDILTDKEYEDMLSDEKAKPKLSSIYDLLSLPMGVEATKVIVNGEEIFFYTYNIAGGIYFKLRDIAYVLNGTKKQFEIAWDGEKNAISLTRGKPYTTVGGEMTLSNKTFDCENLVETKAKIYLDGKEIELIGYIINGNNYFKWYYILEMLDLDKIWDFNGFFVDTNENHTP